jgi:hypothetical protein
MRKGWSIERAGVVILGNGRHNGSTSQSATWPSELWNRKESMGIIAVDKESTVEND